ncbi:hypothetical protein ACFYO1_15165 [Nocardia sp. NPDC006044]|uniref:hypothetical protein n=1 Tax=Nocardia sp. NPDC006044 TaxID=3364306 RepID=UPI003693B4C6
MIVTESAARVSASSFDEQATRRSGNAKAAAAARSTREERRSRAELLVRVSMKISDRGEGVVAVRVSAPRSAGSAVDVSWRCGPPGDSAGTTESVVPEIGELAALYTALLDSLYLAGVVVVGKSVGGDGQVLESTAALVISMAAGLFALSADPVGCLNHSEGLDTEQSAIRPAPFDAGSARNRLCNNTARRPRSRQ